MRDVTLQMGEGDKFTVDLDTLSVKQTDRLRKAIHKVQSGHDPLIKLSKLLIKHPRQKVTEEGQEERPETDEEWKLRITEAEAQSFERLPDESDDAYDERMYEESMVDHWTRQAFEIIEKLCEVLSLPVPSRDQLKEVGNTALGDFVFELLFYHNIPGADTFRVQRSEQDPVARESF
jgi:hypothetical protein